MNPDINLIYVTAGNEKTPKMVLDSSKPSMDINVNVQFYGITSGTHTFYIDLKNENNESILPNQTPFKYKIDYDEAVKKINMDINYLKDKKDTPELIGAFSAGFGLNENDLTTNKSINIVGNIDDKSTKQTKIFFRKV